MVKICINCLLLLLAAVLSAHVYGKEKGKRAKPKLDAPEKFVVGDMILTPRQYQLRYSNDTIKRHGLTNKAFRWPGGIVPVVISPELDINAQSSIKAATNYISKGTCVKFLFDFDPRSHPNHVNIVRASSRCSAQVGYIRAPSTLKIDPGFCDKGAILHELLHVLGLYHMHEAAERNKFIEINFNNIQPGRKDQFKKISTRDGTMFNTAYDYTSVMHYSPYEFAIDLSIPVIKPTGGRKEPLMGQRGKMTEGDFLRVNRMYECPGNQ